MEDGIYVNNLKLTADLIHLSRSGVDHSRGGQTISRAFYSDPEEGHEEFDDGQHVHLAERDAAICHTPS